MGKFTEATRERETFRYGSTLLAESIIHPDSSAPPDPSIAKPSLDTVLTALAQLGALRLQGSRALISLFDQRFQHVVAEATCSTRIDHHGRERDDGGGAKDGDALWLSGTAIPRKYSVCEGVLGSERFRPPPNSTVTNAQCPTSQLRVTVVPDLTADGRLENNPYLGAAKPAARFYAGVPIRTRRGIDIGVYCVIGSDPRAGLDDAGICFLQDMSRTIMTYLETVLASTGHSRNVRMVRGLGSLVEGKGSMSKWWMGDDSASFTDAAGGEGTLNSKQQTLQRIDEGQQLETNQPPPAWHGHSAMPPDDASAPPPAASATAAAAAAADDGSSRYLTQQPEDSDTIPGGGIMFGGGSNLGGDASHTPGANSVKSSGSTAGSTAGTTAGSATQPQEDEYLVAVRGLLSRGANIIRESVQCEGVLFLDAAIGSFGGLVERPESDTPSSGDSPSSSRERAKQPGTEGVEPAKLCQVLGYSTSDFASIDGDLASLSHLSVPEKFLKRLLRRYPEGYVFNFDDSGAVQSGDSSEDHITADFLGMQGGFGGDALAAPPRKTPRPLRPTDGDVLIRTFVGARSIALIPLWDSHKERWFAGGFMWTRAPTRVFTHHGELSFLKAFGMAVMAEVARIDGLQAGKAKADILGSVSHELRSPLHGIILGVELLNDTVLDAFQEDILHTLETCGRTLVDTINHLLDFSKINRFVRMSRRKAGSRVRGVRQEGSSMIETGMMNLYSDISLDSLVEEVVESVYAGYSYQQLSGSLISRSRTTSRDPFRANTLRRLGSIGPMETGNVEALPTQQAPGVTIYLNIDPSARWMFHTQSGAIRRIVMNLFGNALKYTRQGFIVISLTHDVPGTKGKNGGRQTVTLSISDTGKGIGPEYLRNQMFSSFAQEDPLATGVGLGLSLVKQITTTLGGRITVESQLRRGTIVRVSLPLRRSSLSSVETHARADNEFVEQVRQLKGLQVCVVGFTHDISAMNPLVSATSRDGPNATMTRICRDWLQMDLIPKSDDVTPSFYVCTEDALDEIPVLRTADAPQTPVIVVCRDASRARDLATSYENPNAGRICEFISQPAGARNLARILSATLKKWRESLPPPRPASADAASSRDVPIANTDHLDFALIDTNSSVQSSNDISTATDPIPSNPGPANPSSSNNSTFLLVDDNLVNLKILSSFMRKLGQSYNTAENGFEALDSYRQDPENYRCILMDISMPVMDGLESTRLIREFEQQQKLAPTMVIALTGLASASAQQEAFASGVDIFLTKPVPFKELRRILESKGFIF